MYKVKVVISYLGTSSKGYMEGVFIPKGDDCSIEKIKKQCDAFIRKNIKVSGLDRKDLIMKISCTKLTTDFVVCEDKE